MPYKLKEPAWDSKTSVGRGPSLKVVIHGYDPLTVTESKIRIVMSQYGEVAEIKSITDPRTGSYLGVCSVLFRDRSSREGRAISAADAARKAEKDGNGQRIDQSVVKIERDPEGTRAKRYAEHIATKRRLVLEKQLESEKKSAPYPTPTPSSIAVADATAGAPPVISTPPPNAPRGPSNRIVVAPPPRGPGQFIKRPTAHSLLEEEPIVDTLKRKPFIFIAHCYVPALGTTIEHLKKRMKPYKWETVRVDRTGYYIVFEDSKTGKREAIACFEGCHLQPLFNYTMNMECQLDGNPNYKDASKLAAAKALKDERKQIKIEDEADFELEKRERAENLDLSKAALERLVPEVRDKVIIDVQQKLIRAVLLNFLSPENHIERRKKNNIAEPAAAPVQPSNIVFGRNDTTPAVSNARVGYSGGYNRKFVTKIDRSRKQQEDRLPTIDDRRRLKRRQRTTDLHRRLAGFAEDDSDDERHTSITRGSDGIDSRAISEAARSPARFDVDDTGHLTPHSKRRRLASGVDSDDESINLDVRKSLGDLVDKDVVDMDLRELEQILSTAPRTTRLWKTAATEQKLRENIQENDKLFSNLSKHERQNDLVNGIKSEDASVATTPEPIELTKAAKKKMATKTKRKTKKQLQEERDMLLLAGEEVQVDEIRPEPGSTPQIIEEDMEQAGPEVEWGVSTTIPKRTVEDDRSLTHDFAGWQYTIKGEANDTISEDIVYIRLALQNTPAISLGADPDYWAWKENQIKALNNADLMQPPQDTITMSEYYVPNATGCARTEPYAKIKESEKSKYLPHRIKVKELREKRQADASRAPNAIPEATAKALVANKMSHVTSRTNRAEIRRQQTQMARLTNDLESDSIVSKFNQLKKRKKFVRFDRSSIHGWGLYAEENIVGGDMIIEYVGEKIRLRVSECREVIYQKQGIGSSYLFRLDDEDVVDATKKGGIARFINHSCMPNCTAKIITVERTKRIVIYALRDITKGMLPYFDNAESSS